ncbi:hypothetical protein [Prescottella equi]|uniref:Uncharacterized protein n=1 Tax=Rhodococcus hoagii TaxID=43767 RepID=A0AAE5IQB6_RHOHA|nr:hypothetical protein [Prescottella equi]MCD7052923.1 hypothetical protein [Rhodococcus sp. BH2-1]ERN43627.1 hypothetical protein H849_24137 [Prescottella equi NBRC 101255 = C 7]MBM4627710.1 hypothetical protein [Prescottella equi]ORL27653.1 hypothetical protein A6I89_11365 [Prescottella equi]ORM01523.1 hypothetical protein A5N73_12395 [Prescottella equi]
MHANFGLYRPMSIRALALPPHKDDEGDDVDGSITIYLFGDSEYQEPSVNLSMTIEEAEELSQQLANLAKSCRNGEYNAAGHQLVEYSKAKDLEKARRILGEEASTN